jgi:hypothetical protein
VSVKRKSCKFGENAEFARLLAVFGIFCLMGFVQIRFRFDVYNNK